MLSPAWPHAPTHQLSEVGTFIISSATYEKAHHFRGAERLAVLQRGLLKLTKESGWNLEAWAIFSNHYHFIAHSPSTPSATSLSEMLAILHKKTASWVNKLDRATNRKVWHNFWETRLTHQTSYLARRKYVHHNAVNHGIVPIANQYPWCSAAWFERVASSPKVRSICAFKCDSISIEDDFEVSSDW
jgi:putative transposase